MLRVNWSLTGKMPIKFQPCPPGPYPFVGASPMCPPRNVPPGLNHPRAIPPRHYPTGQIPFLFPPLGTCFVLVMASLVLPNMTLGIPLWYINPHVNILPYHPRLYHALTPIQLVPMTPIVASFPSQPQQELALVAKASG